MASRISPEHWRRAEELFGEALELPLEARDAFLERACCSNPTLRGEIERLLTADGKAGDFLVGAVLEGAERPLQPVSPSPPEPRLIGPYRLIRQIGEGGMSVVYLAVRADREVRRRVAIKCLRHGMATADLRRRIRRERQILAGLDHPHIARLYDVGTTAAGLPYFVMEYIEGEPITTYCDRRRLSLEERLDLFCAVCSAVCYAHQNLIVHRDIKPGNILVTQESVPKLLDFGIAKWLNPELTSQHLTSTLPWQQLLTPDYASPEQIRGEWVTTASDIYSLGVLLFELLTGRRPHQLSGRSPQEVERMRTEEEPMTPSVAVAGLADPPAVSRARRVEPQQLRRRLTGDLDNIVAKALFREPQRRYSSAEQLAEDLRRHLAGQPVTARKATVAYRVGRFFRRNRAAVLAALFFVALLTVSAVGLGVLSVRLAQERDQAALERDKAKHYAKVLKEVFAASDPFEGFGDLYPSPLKSAAGSRNLTAREILDRSAERVARLPDDQAPVQADLLGTLGKVYDRLGEYERAQPMLELALASRLQIFGSSHAEVAESLAYLGTLRLHMGELEAAEELHRQALAMRRSLFDERHPEVARSLRWLAMTLVERGRYEEAEELSRRALEMRSSEDAPDPELVYGMIELATILWSRGKLTEAEELSRRALTLGRALFGRDSFAVGRILNNLGIVLQNQGKIEEAGPFLNEAHEVFSSMLDRDHPDVITVRANLASLAAFRRDYARAEELYVDVLEAARKSLGASHPDLAFLLLGIGVSRTELGRPEEGEPFLRQALAIRRQVYPTGSYLTARAEVYLANCLIRLGHYPKAERLLLSGYETMVEHEPPRDLEVAQILNRLIELYQVWGQADEVAHFQSLRAKYP